MRVGITEYIDCAHHLPEHPKCGSLHGHTYQVDVSVEGDHRGGMIIDFADLKKAVREVLKEFDHRDWNAVLEYPTVENICQLIHGRLEGKLAPAFRVRVWEGHGNWAEL